MTLTAARLSSRIFVLCSLVLCFPTADAAIRRPVEAMHGMVVSDSPIASREGVEVLKQGGNAVDAAIAVSFVLAVVQPSAGNIGGGGFMVVHQAKSASEYSIDFREAAPRAAHREMYLDKSGKVVPGLSTESHNASGTPGSVAGMYLAWQKWGRFPWAKLLDPSIRLAEKGFPVSPGLRDSFRQAQKTLSRWPDSRRIFLRDGKPYEAGEVFRQPELARTLALIAKKGPAGFYEGRTARMIADQMKANQGLMTADDLERYRAIEREPVRGTYRGLDVVSMGPPSGGGIVLIEMLNMLEGYAPADLGFGSSAWLHLEAEIMRRGFADRSRFLGDADFVKVPVGELISKSHAEALARSIQPDKASSSASLAPDLVAVVEPSHTTHYSVVDAGGNAVAVTTSLNDGYGSGITVAGAGFLLNNTMDDFSAKPGVPNMFGLLQGEANSIAAGKRPLSAMTPTIVKKDGKALMVLGSPGGPRITTTVFQVLVNVVDYGFNIQRAVDAPRIHHQWMPDEIAAEPDALVADVARVLQAKGHRLESRAVIGDANCIYIDPTTGRREGAADPRADSSAQGY